LDFGKPTFLKSKIVSLASKHNLEAQNPVFIPPSDRMAQSYPQATGSLFVVSYYSQDYGGGILTHPHTGNKETNRMTYEDVYPH
jgi:hypothetical protein